MSWSEFRLRLFSYQREQKNELIKMRRMAWITFIAPYQNPKKLRGMREETWWRIGEPKKATDTNKQRYIDAMVKYLNERNGGIKC